MYSCKETKHKGWEKLIFRFTHKPVPPQMSFASKTHTKVSQFRSSRAAAAEKYPEQFQAFSSGALAEFDLDRYCNIYHWANSQAKKFLTLNPDCPYHSMAVAHDLRQVASQKKPRVHVMPAGEVSRELVERVMSVAVVTLSPALAEETLGKAKFYGFLHKEFTLWYSAFAIEAKEEGGDSAATRWVWQTAKKLSSRSGLSMNYLGSVVNSWLEKRLSA